MGSVEAYRELTVPLAWDQLDRLQEFLDGELSRQGCPAALRARAEMATEELISAALGEGAGGAGTLICRIGQPGQALFRFLRSGAQFLPDLGEVGALLEQPCSRGLRLQVRASDCLLLVGQRGEPQSGRPILQYAGCR